MSENQETRKLTPTERLHEITMTALKRQPVMPEHTVDLTLNAKGDVQIAVAARGGDLEAVADEAVAVFDRLCAKYPRPDAAVPSSPKPDAAARKAAASAKGGAS